MFLCCSPDLTLLATSRVLQHASLPVFWKSAPRLATNLVQELQTWQGVSWSSEELQDETLMSGDGLGVLPWAAKGRLFPAFT